MSRGVFDYENVDTEQRSIIYFLKFNMSHKMSTYIHPPIYLVQCVVHTVLVSFKHAKVIIKVPFTVTETEDSETIDM